MKVFIQTADGVTWDVSEITGNITWKYELEALAGELSMMVASSQFGIGDKVILKHNNYEVFRGMVVSESGKHEKSLTCFDFGWNLNKNEISMQFKGISIKQAILSIGNKFGIGVELPELSTKITKLYKDQPVSDVIKDMLEIHKSSTYTGHYMRVFGNVLAIRSFRGKPPIEIYNIGSDYSLGKSIENLYNKVVIVSDAEKAISSIVTELDNGSIKRYGLLQTIETISEDEQARARNIAKNKLKELNKVEQNFNVTCDGDLNIVAGRLVTIPNAELKGTYLVKEVTHTFKGQHNYRCSLNLEVFN